MKTRYKILIIVIILLLAFMVNTNDVFAVGNVSQGWKIVRSNSTKPDMLFRTYTTPHSSTLEEYHKYCSSTGGETVENGQWKYVYNGNWYTSKWYYDSASVSLPGEANYRTIAQVFHTEMMGDYSAQGSYGYNSAISSLDYNIASINNAIDGSSSIFTTPRFARSYDQVVFYQLRRFNAAYTLIDWGTGLKVTNLNLVGNTEYRYAIVNIGGNNVYIADEIVTSDKLMTLINKAKEAGSEKECYVSSEIISQTKHSSGGYEVSRTAYDFFRQYNKEGDSYWSGAARGVEGTKSMGSAINLYDNKLTFPELSKRTVLVRHINVGANTTISTSIVNSGTRITSNNLIIKTTNPDETLYGSAVSANYNRGTYQEYYEGKVNIDQGVIKSALGSGTNYKCLGYNVSTGYSASSAQSNVNAKISSGKFTRGDTVQVAGKDISSDDDYIVIDFYYTEYDKNVYVNHLYVDKDGYVLPMAYQDITPNDTAIEIKDGTRNISRVNFNTTRIEEEYKKRLNSTIRVSYATDLNEEINNKKVVYRGYEVLYTKTSASSLVGKKVIELTNGDKADISSAVQVNFYYYKENKQYVAEPTKDVEGTLFVKSTGTDAVEGRCMDDGSYSVVSIPSGNKAVVGIKDIPRYMVGAITSWYTPPTENYGLKISVRLNMGNSSKLVSYKGFKYNAGYYKITNMLVYELANEMIYDAESSMKTVGTNMFNWNNSKLQVMPKTMGLNITMYGINNRKIANTETAINDKNNYVSVSLTDKYGYTSGYGSESTLFDKIFLSVSQLKEVDADGNGKVEYADKTKADSILKQYTEELNSAKQNTTTMSNKLTTVKTAFQNVQIAYSNAQLKLEQLKASYDSATSQLRTYWSAYNSSVQRETKLSDAIDTAKSELSSLEQDKANAQTELETAQANMNKAQTELDRLNTVYTTSIETRNNLESAANCTDSVEDNVYIYMDQNEKDKLEECKLNKQAYQKNLSDKVVENAQKEYEDYLDGEYQVAVETLGSATNNVQSLVTKIETKKATISSLERDLAKQKITTEMAKKLHDDYNTETYLPAKKAYESYRDNEYKTAKGNYDYYVDNKLVAKANTNYESAVANEKTYQTKYDDYKKYRDNLYSKYNSYKASYDEYVKLSNVSNDEEIAKALGLTVNIKVQNMIIQVKDTVTGATTRLAEASNNEATKSIKLTDYISSKTIPEVKTERPVISNDVYSCIGSTKIKDTEYNNSNVIKSTVLNGVRILAGEAKYTTKVVIGSATNGKVEDNVYYSKQSTNNLTKVFNVATGKSLTKRYEYQDSEDNEVKYKYVEPINVYTPITATAELTSDDTQIVNQSNNNNIDASIIQLNTPFTIDFGNAEKDSVYKGSAAHKDTSRYAAGYYIKFDFDVHKVAINGKTYKSGARIPAGTWIGIVTRNSKDKAYVTAQAYANVDNNKIDILSEEKSGYTVRAVAYNATSLMRSKSLKYKTLAEMADPKESDIAERLNNICKQPSYFAEKDYDVVIVNRMFDFRVTDVKDVSWKNVFRTASSSVNKHTGFVYYSGTTKWNYKSEKINSVISRGTSEIGRNPLRVLPIGPYKNTDTSYVKAPKMGYRFSYDLKVSGSYYNKDGTPRKEKKVEIATNFYYVSKNGKTYYSEYDEENKTEGIYLFYKNSSGKYTRIDSASGGYSLEFTPNDGYRYITDSATDTLSKNKIKLGTLRKLTLTYEMATISDNGSAITYYGEYKLPNSTIAVYVDKDGNYDINSPLKDGYIGVIFDISAYSGTIEINNKTSNVILSYAKDTRGTTPNTSQWDYEGFLGYTGYGKTVSDNGITLQLEKGKWNIGNELYNKIKGTVILYDIDQRAATDYE